MVKHYTIVVSGLVQGVGFRVAARQEAERLGLAGLAKNQGRDAVYIEAEGEEAALQEFISWCRRGTPWSKVKGVEVVEGELKNLQGFAVIHQLMPEQ